MHPTSSHIFKNGSSFSQHPRPMKRQSVSAVLMTTLLWFSKDQTWKRISSLENSSNVRNFKEKYKPETNGDKIYCAKKRDASMMSPCEHVFLNKIRLSKFAAKICMSSIEALPLNDSPIDFGLEICWQKLLVTLAWRWSITKITWCYIQMWKTWW